MILRHFDPARWRTARAPRPLLFTWNATPRPVDGGMPEPAAAVFAEALSSIGPVVYAAEEPAGALQEAGRAVIRRGLRRLSLPLVCAHSVPRLLPAFESAAWAMGAQWLVVLDAAEPASPAAPILEALHQDWKLADRWPAGVAVIVQAAVDGDGAACFSATQAVDEDLLRALADAARASAIELRIAAEGPCG